MGLLTKYRSIQRLLIAELGTCVASVVCRGQRLMGTSRHSGYDVALEEAGVTNRNDFLIRCLGSEEFVNIYPSLVNLQNKHPLLRNLSDIVLNYKHFQLQGNTVILLSKAAGLGIHKDSQSEEEMLKRQISLAEITDVIYIANIIHKGVVNIPSTQISEKILKDLEHGNKMAILSGDFLLASASKELAALENTKVVEIMSSAIRNLMEAGFTSIEDKDGNQVVAKDTKMEDWFKYTYLSSGCLFAKSCQAALELANHSEENKTHAFNFGKHWANAYQINKDLEAFSSSSSEVWNPALSPVILYLEDSGYKNLDLISSSKRHDHQQAIQVIKNSTAIDQAKELRREHGQLALDYLKPFTANGKSALEKLVRTISGL